MSFEVLTAVRTLVEIFWVMTPCGDVVGYRLFVLGEPCCLHLDGEVARVKMEAAWSSRTSVFYFNTTQRHNREDLNLEKDLDILSVA
jgi:hypothetical protein